MPNTLFQPKSQEGNPNDPFLISPKGVKVQVPEARVAELLTKGFILMDKKWKPSYIGEVRPEPINDFRDFPKPLEEIRKEAANKVDILEVTEI